VECVKTRDFITFSDPLFIWGEGEKGYCSPDISKVGDTYYLTYQSWDGYPQENPKENKQLFYAMSTDLETWTAPHRPLAKNLTEGNRAIDAALACHGGKWYLAWKELQTPQLATADSIDSATWKRLGNPWGAWLENAQFIRVDSRWHMVVTGKPDCVQQLIPMAGNGDSESDWLNWGERKGLSIPQKQGFNENVVANASFLADWRRHDGHFYLIFCSRMPGAGERNLGFTLGIARSEDLEKWDCP
jgi:hypothetical protein